MRAPKPRNKAGYRQIELWIEYGDEEVGTYEATIKFWNRAGRQIGDEVRHRFVLNEWPPDAPYPRMVSERFLLAPGQFPEGTAKIGVPDAPQPITPEDLPAGSA